MSVYNLKNQFGIQQAKEYLERLIKAEAKIKIEKVSGKRSLSQNAYLHVLFTLYGLEVGLTIDESKDFVKRSCPFMTYSKKDTIFVKKTSRLDTKEMTDFIDWFRNWSSKQEIYLPGADEYKFKYDEIISHIEANRQYL